MERQFKCFKCYDKRPRAYFNTRKNKGWCHNCSTAITPKEFYERFEQYEKDPKNYYCDDYTDVDYEAVCQFVLLTSNEISEDAEAYSSKRGFSFKKTLTEIYGFQVSDNKLTDFGVGEFRLERYKRRLFFPCTNDFWLARSYDKDVLPKVLFPSKEDVKIGKSSSLFVNYGQLEFENFFKKIAVICEGDYDSLSTLWIDTGRRVMYVGVGIMGKVLSKDQMLLIKSMFSSDEIVLCLDGDSKSSDNFENKSMQDIQAETVKRLLNHFETVKKIDLGDKDPNDMFLIDKHWLRKSLAQAKKYNF